VAKKVSDDDRDAAKELFAQGLPVRKISEMLDGRVSAAWISKAARSLGWVKGIMPEHLVTPDSPQIYESANATPDEMAGNTDKMQEAVRRRWVDHKAELADKFGEKIAILLDRAFAPYVVQDVKLVGLGNGVQQPTLTKVPLDMPPPADQVKLMTSLAILVDKASLLSGDATSRVETASLNKGQLLDRLAHIKDEVGAARDRAAAARAEAASKGATG
jgi:hypothetical protein